MSDSDTLPAEAFVPIFIVLGGFLQHVGFEMTGQKLTICDARTGCDSSQHRSVLCQS